MFLDLNQRTDFFPDLQTPNFIPDISMWMSASNLRLTLLVQPFPHYPKNLGVIFTICSYSLLTACISKASGFWSENILKSHVLFSLLASYSNSPLVIAWSLMQIPNSYPVLTLVDPQIFSLNRDSLSWNTNQVYFKSSHFTWVKFKLFCLSQTSYLILIHSNVLDLVL